MTNNLTILLQYWPNRAGQSAPLDNIGQILLQYCHNIGQIELSQSAPLSTTHVFDYMKKMKLIF